MDQELLMASLRGDVSFVEKLFCDGSIIFEQILLISAQHGHKNIVSFLFDKGVDIYKFDNFALRLACENGHLDVVKFLIENGADITALEDKSFYLASFKKQSHILKYICQLQIYTQKKLNGFLQWACSEGHKEAVIILTENGADIHAENNYALQEASLKGHVEIVKFLVEKGANIHANDNYSFRRACENGHEEVVEYLFEKGAEIHSISDWSFFYASLNGHVKILKFLFEKGAYNNCAIDNASKNGHIEAVKFLIKIDPNCVHYLENYALRVASIHGYFEIVKILIDNGSENHPAALLFATEFNHAKIVTFLCAHGATQINQAIKKASDKKFFEVAKILYTFKADISLVSNTCKEYILLCLKLEEKKRVWAVNIIGRWWIPKCYDLNRESGKRMAQKGWEEIENTWH